MKFTSSLPFLLANAVALFLLSAGSATAGPMEYLVSVDTSTLSGTSGFLDFQFNPGFGATQLATAEISSFNPGGGAFGSSVNTGDVVGTLPGLVIFVNDTALNDSFAQFTYGGFFSFILSLSGPALNSPDGISTGLTTFGVALFDEASNPIPTSDPGGLVGTIDVNLDGSTTVQPFLTQSGGASAFDAAALPEPASQWLLGLGVAALAILARRARRQSAS